MMFGGDEISESAMELFLFKEKMKSKVFKDYFESVVEARVFGSEVYLGKLKGAWKWLEKKSR